MVRRATDVLGKPVVGANDGERLGTVSDLLLDDTSHHLLGLVVRHGGLRKHERILPASAVKTLGRDAVVSESSAELLEPDEWRRRSVAAAQTLPDEEPLPHDVERRRR